MGMSSVSPFLSCWDRNSNEKKSPAKLERATLKLQATTASCLWSVQLAKAYPLKKQERCLLQLLLETLPPCQSHLYSQFRLIIQI